MKILLVKSVAKLTFLAPLAEGLARRGHEVHLLVPGKHPDCDRMERKGVRVHLIDFHFYDSPGWRGRLRYFNAIFLFVLLYYRHSFDVINLHLAYSRLVGRKASRFYVKKKKAVVSVIHGFESAFEKETNRFDDATVTTLSSLKRYLASEGIPEGKIAVINNGIDLEALDAIPSDGNYLHRELELDPKIRLIGLIAYFYPDRENKGHRTFLEAAKIVLRSRENVRFVLVGGNYRTTDGREYFENLAETLGIRGKVHFLGEREDVPALLSSFYANVLASFKEGFSFSILEAMARRVPCVVSAIDTLREVIEDGRTGLLFEAGNAEALAERIGNLLDDPGQARRLGLAGRRCLEENYRSEEMAGKYEALFHSILGTKAG